MAENKINDDSADLTQINPHMPQFIIKAPWYLNQTEPSLNHHKVREVVTKIPINEHTLKGIMPDKNVYKFRKGACSNCGAETHKTRECCERPRKIGAKFTGKDFRPDEYIYEVPLDYEGKRDRWAGYDPNSFKREINKWEKIEETKNKKKQEALKNITEGKQKKALVDEDIEKSVSSSSSEENGEEQTGENQEEGNNGEKKEFVFKEPTVKREMTIKDMKINNPYSKSNKIGDDFAKYLLNLP